MLKKIKVTIISNLIVRVFMIAFAVIFPASVYGSSALNTSCGSGSFAGTSYLSTPCSSSYNCCIAPSKRVVKKVKPVAKKQIKKVAVAKKPVIVKKV
jgi:hypothetical protein